MDTPWEISFRDALNYLNQIRDAFQYTKPGMKNELLDILRAFVIHRSHRATTLQWTNLLDVNHLDIIHGFKAFLPVEEAKQLVDLRILYLSLQNWLKTSMEVDWSHPDWSRIWDSIGE
ncbi:hypothetical protein BcDW1_8911 [Botrytis cinerea BcDW1]|uniref:Uncharacterized protein n=1 Tax=Botryotinia fuckeliana (strain BcDW1) TaxID=1290391 RepID=M7U736_BOTF1|nr:hypothetical protein BcDW1_8911 [Botrytis cinerea BcDW1]